ncbi:hypothetical protein GCM10023088_68310 [Actinomadura verrucosospora]|uniref:hypothetical protein n=1 Tax=Actinomadura verrucosospora TaxID=46165 RepID=UPI0031EA29D4
MTSSASSPCRTATAKSASAALGARLHALPTAYRSERGGDYTDDLTLRPHLAPGRTDLAVHRRPSPA